MVSPPVQMNADLSTTARALFVYLALSSKPTPPPICRHRQTRCAASNPEAPAGAACLLACTLHIFLCTLVIASQLLGLGGRTRAAAAAAASEAPAKSSVSAWDAQLAGRDDVVLPNRSRMRFVGRNRQGPPPPEVKRSSASALDAASVHRCRSTPARDGYARRNNGEHIGAKERRGD